MSCLARPLLRESGRTHIPHTWAVPAAEKLPTMPKSRPSVGEATNVASFSPAAPRRHQSRHFGSSYEDSRDTVLPKARGSDLSASSLRSRNAGHSSGHKRRTTEGAAACASFDMAGGTEPPRTRRSVGRRRFRSVRSVPVLETFRVR